MVKGCYRDIRQQPFLFPKCCGGNIEPNKKAFAGNAGKSFFVFSSALSFAGLI
jgi:hypothetical protein